MDIPETYQAVIDMAVNKNVYRLRHYRLPDMDLHLQQQNLALTPKLEWVRGHQEYETWETIMDLKSMKLSRDETYNLCRDKAASSTCLLEPSHSDTPVLPAER
jgi:hypothetical protein